MELSLPGFEYKVKKKDGNMMIYDTVRKKYVALTPEEWVRQHVVHYLIDHKGYPGALVAVEKEISLYGLRRRFDVVCFDRNGEPLLIVECKAPAISLSQKVFDQVFGYNLALAARYVAITNGIKHYCGEIKAGTTFTFSEDFPPFTE